MFESAPLNPTLTLLLFLVLIIAVTTDLKSHRIPNILLFPALGVAIVLHTTFSGAEGAVFSIAGMCLGIALLLPLYAMGGMGAGDVKLLGVVGACIGPWATVVAGLSTMMAGAILGIGVILWRRLAPQLQSLVTGMFGTHPHGSGFADHQATTPTITHIAYAPAIAAGTVAALWYIDLLPANGIL